VHDDLGQGHDYQANDRIENGIFGIFDALFFAAAGNIAQPGEDNHEDRRNADDNRQQIKRELNILIKGTYPGTLTTLGGGGFG
jgi:hypothetical protein